MMEWNFGGCDEVSDRFPSPESWPNWGISDADLTEEQVNFNGEMDSSNYDKDQSSSSIAGGGLSDESIHQTPLTCVHLAYQLDGLARFEQIDDLFLNSLINDFPGTENAHESFCFEPQLQNDMEHGDNISTNKDLDTQSVSSETHSMRSSRYLKTHANSPPVEKVGVYSPQFVSCNSQKKHSQLLTAPPGQVLAPSENDSVNGLADEDAPLVESILNGMEMVLAQLTDKTRICFRDALYRLANNSREHPLKSQNQSLPMSLSWAGQNEKLRSGGKKPVESETNTIDRTIANLMFNKMDTNMQDFCLSASQIPNQETAKSNKPCNDIFNEPEMDDIFNEPEMDDVSCYPNFSRDAEVPILRQGYLQPNPFPT